MATHLHNSQLNKQQRADQMEMSWKIDGKSNSTPPTEDQSPTHFKTMWFSVSLTIIYNITKVTSTEQTLVPSLLVLTLVSPLLWKAFTLFTCKITVVLYIRHSIKSLVSKAFNKCYGQPESPWWKARQTHQMSTYRALSAVLVGISGTMSKVLSGPFNSPFHSDTLWRSCII